MKTAFLVLFSLVVLAGDAYAVVYCGNGWTCPDGYTCCLRPNGSFGCCPYRNAVCCCSGKTCCQSLHYCSADSTRCHQCLSFAGALVGDAPTATSLVEAGKS
ncbi:granulin-2-like isoform X2 [Tachypleus tridentatus]|uniref:granulin-2-like isoform X2 n=1 Tax=Tachypleus tridentatus TaxID=6853 RepID=UPI003FD2686F